MKKLIINQNNRNFFFSIIIPTIYLTSFFLIERIVDRNFATFILAPFVISLIYFNKELIEKKIIKNFDIIIAVAVALIIAFVTLLISDNSKLELSVFFIVAVVVVAPICEEIVFRVLVFGIGRIIFGEIVSSFISSLLFAISHSISLKNVVLSFFVGLVFCYLYKRYNSIIYNSFVHGLINLCMIIYFTVL